MATRVLIVEDDKPLLERYVLRLKAGSGRNLDVHGATTIREAVDDLADHPDTAVAVIDLKLYRLDDRRKGPSVWEVKRVRFHPKSEDGLPGEAEYLLVVRHALQEGDVKYFRSNAPEGTPTATLLRMALTRHRVERCFQDRKSELGPDHYEGRTCTRA